MITNKIVYASRRTCRSSPAAVTSISLRTFVGAPPVFSRMLRCRAEVFRWASTAAVSRPSEKTIGRRRPQCTRDSYVSTSRRRSRHHHCGRVRQTRTKRRTDDGHRIRLAAHAPECLTDRVLIVTTYKDSRRVANNVSLCVLRTSRVAVYCTRPDSRTCTVDRTPPAHNGNCRENHFERNGIAGLLASCNPRRNNNNNEITRPYTITTTRYTAYAYASGPARFRCALFCSSSRGRSAADVYYNMKKSVAVRVDYFSFAERYNDVVT